MLSWIVWLIVAAVLGVATISHTIQEFMAAPRDALGSTVTLPGHRSQHVHRLASSLI